MLEIARALQQSGKTVVMVLHELHLAFRYATHLVVMQHGRIMAAGEPGKIVTADLISEVFDVACEIIPDPADGTPTVLPRVGVR